MELLALPQEHWLEIADSGGVLRYGADQEWYGQLWRRKAGCGPTAAAAQLCYLAHTRPGWEALCPPETLERAAFTAYMDRVWDYVTPGPQGLNTLKKYSDGARAFALDRGVEVHPLELAVPKKMTGRPGFDVCLSFLRAGLESGCPVAFLNLHNGKVENLDAWHWVLITGLAAEGGSATVLVSDGGAKVALDLRLWYDTTKEGGGFVYLAEGPA